MDRNKTHHRGIRLVVLVSSVVLWRVGAMPSRTCESSHAPTTGTTPALAYFSVTSITVGTQTFVISFSSSNVSTSRQRRMCLLEPAVEPLALVHHAVHDIP